jgi:DNA polymerase I-like protein with 3'-5' exonuclease and polymerase domains
MSCRGLRTDPVACARLEKRQKRLIEAAKKFAQKPAKVSVAPNLTTELVLVDSAGKRKMAPAKALMLAACEKAGIKVPLTDKGQAALKVKSVDAATIRGKGLENCVSTDAEACEATGNRTLRAFSIYGSANTLLKKVETIAQGSTLPLQTRFEVLKETGRTSSKAPGDPLIGDNFQNPPRAGGYRQCFVPRPGYVFCSVDYDGAELHSLAQVCLWALGHSRLAQVLNDGLDPHLLMAAERLLKEGPISYAEAERRLKAKDPLIKHARQTAKVPNFGLPGGLGADTLIEYAKQYRVKLTYKQAVDLIEAWRAMWPEMVEYFAWIKAQLGDGLATIKQYVSLRTRGLIPYTVACNTYFQGLTADAAKSALLPLARECYLESENSVLYGSYPVLFIHDEVLAELPEETAHLAGPRMAEIMVDRFNDYHPDVHVTAQPALMRRWYKDAEPVYENGKLVPWEPKRHSWKKVA